MASLESRVLERTIALEKRANQLQAAAAVGHAVARIRNLDELLKQVTHLISNRFGYYHTGIFLLDERREYALLQAANSPGGQRMLLRRHKLKVGEEGIVGRVTASGESHIALDVGKDAIYFDNPDMPETRSEMALPLISGDEILGALDIQSKEPSAFIEEDTEVLQVLADQVAVAIQNARLFQENQEAIESLREAYGEITATAWRERLAVSDEVGYLSLRSDTEHVIPAGREWTPENLRALKSGEITLDASGTGVAIPIRVRGSVIGVVRLSKPEGAEGWTKAEISMMQTLSEQLAAALDAARLFEETQRKAERERLAGEITARMRASNDPEEILQTAVQELRRALGAKRAQVIVAPRSSTRQTGELTGGKRNGDNENSQSQSDLI
jgi:GAF domain-containing protein